MRLVQQDVVDHCVCVDALKGLIYDGEEKHPIFLSTKTLKLFRGDEESKIRISEARKVVKVSRGN